VVGPRTLMVPAHPGIQYHFCRTGLPIFFLGNWDQFMYWRPRPENVHDLLPEFHPRHLSFGQDEYRGLLTELTGGRPDAAFDLAWLHFPWQFKMFRDMEGLPKVYCAAKWDELSEAEWQEILDREDFLITAFYPRTARYLRERFGRVVPFIPIGLDQARYGRHEPRTCGILSVIHSWSTRQWHYAIYREATEGLPTCHVDHLAKHSPPRDYDALLRLFNGATVYLHDGEQEYTIALAEALMSGLPVVSFDLPGVSRYVQHGVNGFIGRTAAQIRTHCEFLLDHEDVAAQFGAASRRLALREFPEANWISQWRAVISAFVGERRGSAPASARDGR
jgi:glycosyltransferase involved in cell wall biosynthesis